MTTEGADFDLRERGLSITECKECSAPVSGRPSGGRVALVCGYCGLEDLREIAPEPKAEAEAAYRGKPRGAGGRPLPMDLDAPPEGWTRTPDGKAVRDAWVAEKKKAVPEGASRGEHEYLLTWLAVTNAARDVGTRDFLKARAVLEAALDVVRVPAYRAMILARLARLAAMAGSADLARDWLAQIPSSIRVPEVRADVRVGEAFIARAKEDWRGVLRAVGEEDADAHAGPSRWLAHALRVDAYERLGERGLAMTLWTKGAVQSRRGDRSLGVYAGVYGLAPATRRRALYRGLYALGVVAALVIGVVSALRGLADDGHVPRTAVVALGVALVGAIGLRLTR